MRFLESDRPLYAEWGAFGDADGGDMVDAVSNRVSGVPLAFLGF